MKAQRVLVASAVALGCACTVETQGAEALPDAPAMQEAPLWGRSDVIDITDYGATPDGGALDGQAIQDAINAAQGRTVYAPPGVYHVDIPLTWATGTCGYPGASGLRLIGG